MYDAAAARRELVEYGRKIEAKGLVVGPGGNTSVRVGQTVYVKASGTAFEDATEEDYVGVDLATGELVDGTAKPTCEILMHLGCYLARDEVRAVVHTHAPLATGVSSAGRTLEPLFPDFVALLGPYTLPVIDYVIPAGRELAERVAAAAKDYDAMLLANHGVVTLGTNLREAYFRNVIVEEAARTLIAAESVGTPRLLTPQEADDVENLEAEDYRRALLSGLGTVPR